MLVLNLVAGNADALGRFHRRIPSMGATPDELLANILAIVVPITNWLIFTQFLGIAAVIAGHSVLHDRQSNTLPFLLLAPVRRGELLAGKVLGSIGFPFLIYVIFSGTACALIASTSVAAPYANVLPPSPAWLVAFFLGGPAWACAIGSICAIISSMTRDVRTAQQGVWLVVLIAQFACGLMLTVLLPDGPMVQLGVALTGFATAALTIWMGSQVISRDLSS